MPDNLERYNPPQSAQAPAPQQDEFADEEQPQESKPGWEWIGSPNRPEAKKHEDGISDLFEVGGNEDDVSDLVEVDIDRDVIDTNERGSLDDLTEVSEADILGDEETGQVPLEYTPDEETERAINEFNGQRPQPRYRATPQRRATRPYNQPPTMGGMR